MRGARAYWVCNQRATLTRDVHNLRRKSRCLALRRKRCKFLNIDGEDPHPGLSRKTGRGFQKKLTHEDVGEGSSGHA